MKIHVLKTDSGGRVNARDKRVDWMKIDVEGMETAVMLGARMSYQIIILRQ